MLAPGAVPIANGQAIRARIEEVLSVEHQFQMARAEFCWLRDYQIKALAVSEYEEHRRGRAKR